MTLQFFPISAIEVQKQADEILEQSYPARSQVRILRAAIGAETPPAEFTALLAAAEAAADQAKESSGYYPLSIDETQWLDVPDTGDTLAVTVTAE